MDEMTYFRKNALLANLCQEWNGKWAACHDDKEKLMRLVLSQQAAPYFATFCYEGKGLTKEYCLREFGDLINERMFSDCDEVEGGFQYRMYIEGEKNVFIAEDVIQALWCEGTNFIVPSTKATTMYVSNRSKVSVSCDGYNSIRLYLFDESEVTFDNVDEDSNIIVYLFSDNAKVIRGKYCMKEIKCFRKTLRL